jgi:hypothetical protein
MSKDKSLNAATMAPPNIIATDAFTENETKNRREDREMKQKQRLHEGLNNNISRGKRERSIDKKPDFPNTHDSRTMVKKMENLLNTVNIGNDNCDVGLYLYFYVKKKKKDTDKMTSLQTMCLNNSNSFNLTLYC